MKFLDLNKNQNNAYPASGTLSSAKALACAGMFAALIFVSIFFLSVPNGLGGFIHFGDALIFTAAAVLPFPYGLVAAAVGPGLFNLARGPVWLPFTIVIKPLMAMCFSNKSYAILGSKRNVFAPFLAAGINTAFYFFANVILFSLGMLPAQHIGAWAAGFAALPALFVQGVGSVVFFFLIAKALDRANIKERLFRF